MKAKHDDWKRGEDKIVQDKIESKMRDCDDLNE